jgi:two-component system response regulator BaeR
MNTSPSSKSLILIVEDEIKLAHVMQEYLQQAGFSIHLLHTGDQVMPWLAKHNAPSLIVLDLMLPGVGGLSLCRQIREQSSLPIIMITALVEEKDRLQGLEIGADDYMCKPFSLNEMVARVKVVLRRTKVEPTPISAADINPGVFKIETDKMRITVYDHLLDLTRVEFRLLKHMLEQPLIVFSRNDLLDVIYDDYRLVSDRTIDSHIKNVRKKIQHHFPDQDVIHSIYGVGYKFQLNLDVKKPNIISD